MNYLRNIKMNQIEDYEIAVNIMKLELDKQKECIIKIYLMLSMDSEKY